MLSRVIWKDSLYEPWIAVEELLKRTTQDNKTLGTEVIDTKIIFVRSKGDLYSLWLLEIYVQHLLAHQNHISLKTGKRDLKVIFQTLT